MKSINEMTEVTPFQQRVYDEVRLIPLGEVITYGELARRIGCKSARAVPYDRINVKH